MITKNKDLTFAIISLFAILFLICFISAQSIYSNPQYTSPGFSPGLSGIQGISGISGFNAQMCGKSQDFILQIAPFGCSPAVVRSDLLEERNVPVFCPVLATKINPLIDVEAIESMTFRGEYSPGVSGVGFYPARAAVKRTYSTLINSPTLENVGYAVIVLNQQPNESAMPNFVQGNLTAFIRYDIENAYGIGPATRYLPLIDNDEWSNKFRQYGFWNGKALLRAEDVEDNSAVISIYLDENSNKQLLTSIHACLPTNSQMLISYCSPFKRSNLADTTLKNSNESFKFCVTPNNVIPFVQAYGFDISARFYAPGLLATIGDHVNAKSQRENPTCPEFYYLLEKTTPNPLKCIKDIPKIQFYIPARPTSAAVASSSRI